MSNCDCKHPELKPENAKCSDKQIKECHGKEEVAHPCEKKK